MSDESASPLIATPDYMRGRAAAIHSEVLRQSSQLGRLPADRADEWRAFRTRWVRWYTAGPNWFWGATDATLDEFARDVRAWADLLVSHGGSAPARQPGIPQTVAQRAAAALGSLAESPLVWVGLAAVLYAASQDGRRK